MTNTPEERIERVIGAAFHDPELRKRVCLLPTENLNGHKMIIEAMSEVSSGPFTRPIYEAVLANKKMTPEQVSAHVSVWNKCHTLSATVKPGEGDTLLEFVAETLIQKNLAAALDKFSKDKAKLPFGQAFAKLHNAMERMRMATCDEPVAVCMADVKREEIDWAWTGRIALGKLTLISGDPGGGKSTLSLDIASRVSTGAPWPDGSKGVQGSVILISAEDDVADTIGPRLDANNADSSKIHVLQAIRGRGGAERSVTLDDIPQLEQMLKRLPDCKLIVIDPLSAVFGSEGDSHKDTDARAVMQPLVRLAKQYGVAILIIAHLNKNAKGQKAIYRTSGTLGFVALVRTAYIVTKDQDNPARRLLLPVKNNIGPDSDGFAFTISDKSRIEWESGTVETTADDALDGERPEGRLDEAVLFLSKLLADGPVPKRELEDAADAHNITSATLRRASVQLKVETRKGRGQRGNWCWELPQPLPPAVDDQPF